MKKVGEKNNGGDRQDFLHLLQVNKFKFIGKGSVKTGCLWSCSQLCVVFLTYFWSPTESRGSSLWLYTLFAQPKVCQHHMALHTGHKKTFFTQNHMFLVTNTNKSVYSFKALN